MTREGPRFGALITTAVLIVVLITGSAWLLAAQAVVFAIGRFFGLRYAPYGLIYRYAIRPRLGPPSELEAEAPPRFAQGVGLVFAVDWRDRLRERGYRTWRRGNGARADRRILERSLRHLPGL